MQGEPPIYKGKVIPRKDFRVYIYGMNCAKKLVESWESFEAHMATGVWFATKSEAQDYQDKRRNEKELQAQLEEKLQESVVQSPKRGSSRKGISKSSTDE